MTLGDDFGKAQEERAVWLERQSTKRGDYSADECPNCGRVRLMIGGDGKNRCEKCAWCVEDGNYDFEFLDFIR